MALPGRAFFTIHEAAARWGCTPTDIVEWATLKHLNLVTSVPMVMINGERKAGLMQLDPADILQCFRRDGSGPTECKIFRLRANDVEDGAWLFVDDEYPLQVRNADILITSADAEAFEAAHEIGPRAAARVWERGLQYDWDAFWVWVCRRVFEEGMPETQKELVHEAEAWFTRQSDGRRVPEETTIQKRIRKLFREIQTAD